MNPLIPIELAVAWIMVKFHALLSLFMDPNSGWTWLLSIVGLTAVIRTLIIPLFVRQIRASRAMQMVGPELQAIQKKYKGKTDPESRQAMAQETMEVYREAGANPLSSCLPVLLQLPIFLALFRVLYTQLPAHARGGAQYGETFGALTPALADSAHQAVVFGTTTISDSFLSGDLSAKLLSGIIIALMCAVTFVTQKELTMRNMPPSALEGPMASTQKMMLYTLPFIYVFTGPGMPIGVLIYWLTTNVWTLVQQWIVIRNTPTPGSPAERNREERINRKRERKGLEPIDFEAERRAKARSVSARTEVAAPIRVQPTGKKRATGKKLTDAEKLERARQVRARAAEERRAAQAASGSSALGSPSARRGKRGGSGAARR
ncbi:membrane protein insertase YidC [Brachybacterium sp. EF45031]|uniref:membrane protein insertase YidC n=1 Tax=Brachybacterium sillae TaxID=2810536 RepID=UPI00217CCA9A|nr:membrane protein insertase YidC [Brachybacterium sillae]MCS6711850.1 membrane protein insertase YidC [Brachybacterium sillae]